MKTHKNNKGSFNSFALKECTAKKGKAEEGKQTSKSTESIPEAETKSVLKFSTSVKLA
jgi:subtilisin-like proprotein convertase family protein